MPAITKRESESQRGSPKKTATSRHGSPQKGSPQKGSPKKTIKGKFTSNNRIAYNSSPSFQQLVHNLLVPELRMNLLSGNYVQLAQHLLNRKVVRKHQFQHQHLPLLYQLRGSLDHVSEFKRLLLHLEIIIYYV